MKTRHASQYVISLAHMTCYTIIKAWLLLSVVVEGKYKPNQITDQMAPLMKALHTRFMCPIFFLDFIRKPRISAGRKLLANIPSTIVAGVIVFKWLVYSTRAEASTTIKRTNGFPTGVIVAPKGAICLSVSIGSGLLA